MTGPREPEVPPVTPDRIHALLMALVALVILEGFGILWLVIALHRIMAELRLS